jgi:hypothetical protein
VRQNRLEYHLQPEGFIVSQVQDLVVCYLIDFLIEGAGSGVQGFVKVSLTVRD